MPLELIRNDIVKMQVDAVVNAANSSLAPGGGVCGAIFSAAGYEKLDKACRKIGHCDVGQAVMTPGFALPAKYIIHTVGPIWRGGMKNEAGLLRSCYLSSLRLAEERRCQSIAFPLISSGIYGYPKEEAFRIAVTAIEDFLMEHDIKVYLIVFGQSSFILGKKLFSNIKAYIDDHYVDSHNYDRRTQTELLVQQRQIAEQEEDFAASTGFAPFDDSFEQPVFGVAPSASVSECAPAAPAPASAPASKKRSLKDLLFHLDESFSKMLFRLIDEKGMTDVEVYKRANIDRKLFSKIRKDSYNPSKQTAIALAIALQLNLDETKDLLGRAGYALSPSHKSDVIIEYFITEGIYNIFEINEALFAFDQKLLGA